MEQKQLKNIFLFIAIIFLCFLLFSFYEWDMKPLLANQYVNRAEAYAQYMDFGRAFQEYENALDLNTHTLNPYTRYRYGMTALSYGRLARYFGVDLEKSALERAIRMQEENQIFEWPEFTRNYTVAGQLANALFEDGEEGYEVAAEEYFGKALSLSPYRPSIYLDMAKTSAIAGDYIKAEERIGQALEINQDNVEAKYRLLILRIQQKSNDEAWAFYRELGQIGYGLFSIDVLNELAITWEEAGDKETALRFYKKLAFLWPQISHYQDKVEQLSGEMTES